MSTTQTDRWSGVGLAQTAQPEKRLEILRVEHCAAVTQAIAAKPGAHNFENAFMCRVGQVTVTGRHFRLMPLDIGQKNFGVHLSYLLGFGEFGAGIPSSRRIGGSYANLSFERGIPMVIATVSATLAALKTSVDLAQKAIAARDEAKLAESTQLMNERVIDVQNAALQLQEKQSAARDEIEMLKDDLRTMKAKVAELEDWLDQRSHYKLEQLAEGSFAYAYVPSSDDGTPMHWVCQGCMDSLSKKYVLKETKNFVGIGVMTCPSCKHEIYSGRDRPIEGTGLVGEAGTAAQFNALGRTR